MAGCLSLLDKVACMLYIEAVRAGVFINLTELLIVDDKYDLLLTQLTQLHALFNQVSLSLALRVVPVDIVLD